MRILGAALNLYIIVVVSEISQTIVLQPSMKL